MPILTSAALPLMFNFGIDRNIFEGRSIARCIENNSSYSALKLYERKLHECNICITGSE